MKFSSTLDRDFDSLPALPDVPGYTKTMSPERALWLSVLANAWADAFQRSLIGLRNTDRHCDPEFEIAEARRWLTLNFGDWREDRVHVCSLADIDEPMLRNAARKRMAEVKRAEAEGRKAKVVELDTAFAALLDNESSMKPEDLDAALAELAA